MEKDFRYKMRHIGDAFVDKVEKVGLSIKGSVRGIVLTYNIDELKKEKEKIVNGIGKRMVAGRKKDPDFNVLQDKMMIKLFSKLDKVEGQMEACIKERRERLYPNKFASKQSDA